jgi:hypothetical protein
VVHLREASLGPRILLRIHSGKCRRMGFRCIRHFMPHPSRKFGNVKIYLTDRQVLRLLCIGGRCNLFTVRSIQSTENVHDEPIPTHRALRAGASSGFSHDRFRTRFPVGVADDVIVIRHSCLILRVTQGRAGLSQTPMYSLNLLDIRNGCLCTRSWDNRPVARPPESRVSRDAGIAVGYLARATDLRGKSDCGCAAAL